MPGNSNIMSSKGRSEALSFHRDLPVPVVIRPMPSARRLRLRFDEIRGVLKLTCPKRMSERTALAWAAEQRGWVEAQMARAMPAEPFLPGSAIPVEGQEVQLTWIEGEARTPRLVGQELVCGGPREAFSKRIESFLRRHALTTLSREAAEFAGKAGVAVRAVSIGDASTRWGSCSAERRIRFSWRLILAPPEARRYVVAHEVAHLVHLNHGSRFKALEAKLFDGDIDAARASLRLVGPRLKRIGRGS
jgi:predicted metal-dependent hydrolase